MYFGRFIFGLGGENLTLAVYTYCARWFSGTALNMAFGFQLSVARFGAAACLMVMGPIYNAFLPKQCVITSNTILPTMTTLSPKLSTFPANISIVTNRAECKKEENKALGIALAIARAYIFLSLLASIIAGLLDKRREIFIGKNFKKQPKVCECI